MAKGYKGLHFSRVGLIPGVQPTASSFSTHIFLDKMSRFTISQFAFCVLVMCTVSNFCLGAENKDSGKTDAHRLGWGGAIASAGYPGYPPGAYAGVGGYGRAPYPYGGYPYGGFPAYPQAAYPDPYYGASPWSFKTNDGKKLPE